MPQLYRLFKALGDPTRLGIIRILLEQPACVCELEERLNLPQPLVSRHLATLRHAGLVCDQRQGMRVNYSVALGDKLGQKLQSFLRDVLGSQEESHEHQGAAM